MASLSVSEMPGRPSKHGMMHYHTGLNYCTIGAAITHIPSGCSRSLLRPTVS